MRVLGNILWIILGGLAIAIGWALVGLILCISIIGIPLGIQAFKMAGLTLTPFGKTVQYGGGVGSALAKHPVGGAGRLVDGARLSGSRRTQLHHHYRYSVRTAIVQDGQARTLAVRRGNRQPVDSKYYKAAKATLDKAITDVNNWIDQQAAKAE